MAYRSLLVANPARVSCRLGQLVVRAQEEQTFPIEDLSAVLIESRQSIVTAAALAALAQNGTAVYFCDEKHLPCALLLPFAQHSRQLEVTQAQLALPLPVRKRAWQHIVTAKIQNQAECLALCGRQVQAAWLFSRAKAVHSGDKENVEAAAAAYYFPALFGAGFTRGDEADTRNAALNYGYAILRGCMARAVAVYGFLPWLGLHHASGLNAFNLADDMMEPYRPVVDLFVAEQVDAASELDTRLKGRLFNLLNADVLSGGQRHSVAYAMERQVQGLRRQTREDAPLLLPKLLPLQQHSYE